MSALVFDVCLTSEFDDVLTTRSAARSIRRSVRRILGIGDTGATMSVTGIKRHFVKLVPLLVPTTIVMGKGTAQATHIGIVEWNFDMPGHQGHYFVICELVLYCADFRDLTIYSLSSWNDNGVVCLQGSDVRYAVSTNGVTSRFVPWQLAAGDSTSYRMVIFRRAANGLSVADTVPTHDLPTDAVRLDFHTGEPYTLKQPTIDRLQRAASTGRRPYVIKEAAHFAIALASAVAEAASAPTPVPYGYFYHGKGFDDGNGDDLQRLGLHYVGGHDNCPASLTIQRRRHPNALSLDDCDHPGVFTVLRNIDLAIYTPPCQSYSIGGNMLGASDPEGRHLVQCLIPQILASKTSRSPICTLLELVPGARLMPEFEIVQQQLRDCGTVVTVHELNALRVGSSSQRDRIWLLGVNAATASALPHAYSRLLNSLSCVPTQPAGRPVISYLRHPLDRPSSHIRLPSEYASNGKTWPDGTVMKIGWHRSRRIEDDLFSAMGMATVQRSRFPGWYLVDVAEWERWHGYEPASGPLLVSVRLTPRESASAMDLDARAPIGEEFGPAVSQRLVGNGVPHRMMLHLLCPVVTFIRAVHAGFDPPGPTVRFGNDHSHAPPQASTPSPKECALETTFGPISVSDDVNVADLLRDPVFEGSVASTTQATTSATAARPATTATTGAPLASTGTDAALCRPVERQPVVADPSGSPSTTSVPPDSVESSYMPFRLDFRYIQRTGDQGWKPMLSPADPRFARKVYEVFVNHKSGHRSADKMEKMVATGYKFRFPMQPGDTRYMPVCPVCVRTKLSRLRMRERSRTLGANRPIPLPGEQATMDTQDFGGSRSGNLRAHFGNHRFAINFCDMASDMTVSYYSTNLDHRSIHDALRYYIHFCKTTTRRDLRHVSTDLAPAHYEQGVLANLRIAHGFEMEAVARDEHEKRGRIERKNDLLLRATRTNLHELIGITFKGVLITKANVGKFWNLAHHRASFDLWHEPSAYLTQEYQDHRAPIQVWFESATSIDLSDIRPFGEAVFHYPKRPSDRHNLDDPWRPAIYLFPASYSPFTYKMVHVRPGVVIIDQKHTLQVSAQLRFNDGAHWSVQAAELMRQASATATAGTSTPVPTAAPAAATASAGAVTPASPAVPLGQSPRSGLGAATPASGVIAAEEDITEPIPVVHDPDPIEWDNVMHHSPPYEIRLGKKGERGKSGMSRFRFEKYRTATTVSEYQRLHPKQPFDVVNGLPVWRPRRSGEPFVSWSSEFRNDISKGLFRFVRPDLQAKINAKYKDAAAEFGVTVAAELASARPGGGKASRSSGNSSDPTTATGTTDNPDTAIPTSSTTQPRPHPRKANRRGSSTSSTSGSDTTPGLRRSTRLTSGFTGITLLMALGHAAAAACGWKGPRHTYSTEATLQTAWTTDEMLRELETGDYRLNPGAPRLEPGHIDAILHNRRVLRDPELYSDDTGDEISMPINNAEDRRRALQDATHWTDHDWVEETADLIAFNLNLTAICLNINVVHKNHIHLKTEKIAELKKIEDAEERRLAAVAILKEIQQLCDLGTFELVERRPGDSRPIGSRLVLKVKYRSDGTYDKHKARLTALGYQQRPGFDFFGTFSPMASLTTVRTILSWAVEHGAPVYHSDIPNAFCQSDIDVKGINFTLPAGIEVEGLDESHVLRLLKSLYGLKQSPATFRKLINKFMTDVLGFVAASSDTCLYSWSGPNDSKVFICSEVDDLVIAGNDHEKIKEIQQKLEARFKSEEKDFDWEPISSFLGIDINYNYDYMKMQPDAKPSCTFGISYKIEKLFQDHPYLQKLGHDSNVPSHANEEHKAKVNLFFHEYGHHCDITTDYDTLAQERANKGTSFGVFNLLAPVGEKLKSGIDWRMNSYLREHYRSIVGSLLYMMITCRPDLCFAVGKLSRHMHDPEQQHLEWLKRTLRYLRQTMDDKLNYTSERFSPAAAMFHDVNCGRADLSILVGFTDANHANAREAERKSISGFCYFLFGNLIMWKSKVQPITAGSTFEAELIALSFCADEGLWIRNMMNEAGIATASPIPIMCDNQGTVFTAHNPNMRSGSKHLEVRFFRVRQHINARLINVVHCRTNENIADFFTKSLAYPQFDKYRNILLNCDRQLRSEWAVAGKAARTRRFSSMQKLKSDQPST